MTPYKRFKQIHIYIYIIHNIYWIHHGFIVIRGSRNLDIATALQGGWPQEFTADGWGTILVASSRN